jgi:hypothetical protein
MYCWAKKNQRSDLVKGSTPSKTKKKTAVRAGSGNVEAPAPNDRNRKRGLHRVPLGTRACKEGMVPVVGEWSPQPGKNPQVETSQKEKSNVASAALGRKGNGDPPKILNI